MEIKNYLMAISLRKLCHPKKSFATISTPPGQLDCSAAPKRAVKNRKQSNFACQLVTINKKTTLFG